MKKIYDIILIFSVFGFILLNLNCNFYNNNLGTNVGVNVYVTPNHITLPEENQFLVTIINNTDKPFLLKWPYKLNFSTFALSHKIKSAAEIPNNVILWKQEIFVTYSKKSRNMIIKPYESFHFEYKTSFMSESENLIKTKKYDENKNGSKIFCYLLYKDNNLKILSNPIACDISNVLTWYND